MDLWEDLEEAAGLHNNPAYVQLWEDKWYQGDFQIHGLEEFTEVSKHELTAAAKCTAIQLLGDNEAVFTLWYEVGSWLVYAIDVASFLYLFYT